MGEVIEYTTYTNNRTGEQRRFRRILDDASFSDVRSRELALLRVPDRNSDRYASSNDDLYALSRRQARWGDDYNDGALVVRRRDGRSPSSSRSPPPRRRRDDRRRDDDRRARSAQPPPAGPPQEHPGYLFYSMKSRHEGNFVERNFDSSYDGLIAGAAGAAIGAITARRFGVKEDDKHRKLKILGGALAGGLGFNAAENWYRVFTEEREERKEEEEAEERAEEEQEGQEQQQSYRGQGRGRSGRSDRG